MLLLTAHVAHDRGISGFVVAEDVFTLSVSRPTPTGIHGLATRSWVSCLDLDLFRS